jgi:hypothetical protein
MDVKTWIEIVELVLKIVVAIAAGGWAFSLLVLLKQRELAQAALRKSEAEIRDIELRSRHVDAQIRDIELKAKQQAVVSVGIESTVYRSPEGGYILLAVVELTNRGGRNTKIKWRDEPPAFRVRVVKFDAEGMASYDSVKELQVPLTLDPTSVPNSHIIRAGGTESISFSIRVPIAGVYLLSFRGVVDEQERTESAKLGADLPVAWTGNRYVLVGDA